MPTTEQIKYQVYVDDRTEMGTRDKINSVVLPEMLRNLRRKAKESGLEKKLRFKQKQHFGRDVIIATADQKSFERFYGVPLTKRLQGGWVPQDRVTIPDGIIDENYRGMVSISILNQGRPQDQKPIVERRSYN